MLPIVIGTLLVLLVVLWLFARRASMTGQMRASAPKRLYASPSSVGTGTMGSSSASPRPFAVAAPIRSPVKEPGPEETAIASIFVLSSSAMRQISSSMGRSVCECVFL